MLNLVLTLMLIGCASLSHADDFSDAKRAFDNLEYAAALRGFRASRETRGDDSEVLFYLARTELILGDYKDARQTVEALLEVDPTHLDGHYLAGLIYLSLVGEVNVFRKMGMAKSAVGAWKRMVELDDNNLLGNYAVFSFYANAPGFAGGDLDEAKALLPKLQIISPAYAEMARAALAVRAEDFSQAEQHYLRATELMQSSASPLFAIAQFYYQQEQFNKSLDAMLQYQKAEKRWHDPSDAMIHFSLGSVYARLGNIELARSNFERALLSYPNRRIRELVTKALSQL